MASSFSSAIANLQSARAKANAENVKRLNEALSYYDKLVTMFSPGGDYGKSLEASLSLGRRKAVSTGMQNLVTSGLANTSMAAGLGTAFEQQVANPARLQLEDIRMGKLSEALMGKAGVLERVEDYGPSDELVASQPSGYGTRTIYNKPTESLWARSERLRSMSTANRPTTRPTLQTGLQPSGRYVSQLGTIYGAKTARARAARGQ